MNDILQTFRDFYRTPAVRSRILEFLGGETPAEATCEFITADGTGRPLRAPRNPEELFAHLEEGLDIGRSLLDRRSLLAHFDVEYVNFDFPAEAYLDPGRAFLLQEPVARAIRRVLNFHGIEPLHVLSGRGHHFSWRIERSSEVFSLLAESGRIADPVERGMPGGDQDLAMAFAGLGMVLEFASRIVQELVRGECRIPVELTAVEVPPGNRGREMISLDLSEYGDPLPTRTVRVPFSAYLKPWQQSYAVGSGNLPRIGPIIFVPVEDMDVRSALLAMRDPAQAARLAERVSAAIPDQTFGMGSLLRQYRGSALRRYHEFFYSAAHDPSWRWPSTYDRAYLEDLPHDAKSALLFPNDLLLKPSGIRAVTEALVESGWHPRHVAGLIRSKFERDYGWGDHWLDYSPAMRADFYVRIFASTAASVEREAARIRGEAAWEELETAELRL
jgi:hypothetical protein